MLNFSLGQIEYRGVSDESKEKTFCYAEVFCLENTEVAILKSETVRCTFFVAIEYGIAIFLFMLYLGSGRWSP